MAHLYEEKPDDRQSNDTIKLSRFRPRYRQLTDNEKALHDNIKAKAEELEALFDQVPAGRYSSLAMTSLETAIMWIIKQLTA